MPPEVRTAVMKSLHSLRSAQVRLAEAEGKRMNFPQGEVVPFISPVWRSSAVPIPSSVEQEEVKR